MWKGIYPKIERIIAEKNKITTKAGFEFMVSENTYESPIIVYVGVEQKIAERNYWFSKLFKIEVCYTGGHFIISVDRLSPDRVPYEIETSKDDVIDKFKMIVDNFIVKDITFVKNYKVVFSGGETEESADHSVVLDKF